MILDAVLLLETRLMCLVDDDQAEAAIGEEKSGAGADRDPRLTRRDSSPSAAALALAQARMPGHRLAAEAGREALQEGLGERDFGEQDEHLLAAPDRLGDRLEVDFGLARAGDAVEQPGRELPGVHRRAQFPRRPGLGRFQRRRVVIRIRRRKRVVDPDLDRLDRAHFDKAADHAVGHAADDRQLADQALPVADPLQRLFTLRCQPVRHPAGGAIFGDRARGLQRARGGEGHSQDGRERREIVIRSPLHEPAERCGDGRDVIGVDQVPEPIVADMLARQPLRLPDHADQLPRPQRRDHDRARLDIHALRHPIVERAQGRVHDDQSGTGHHG